MAAPAAPRRDPVLCNGSICRNQRGWMPTGAAYPTAKHEGAPRLEVQQHNSLISYPILRLSAIPTLRTLALTLHSRLRCGPVTVSTLSGQPSASLGLLC